MKDKLLVHACCGPCLVGVYENIEQNLEEYGLNILNDFDVIWYNPNIHPKEEYELRKETLQQFLEIKNKEGIYLDEYNLLVWAKNALNFKENGYEFRCEYCYISRLEKVFEYARDNGYTMVTTTLLISPYQKHDIICRICNMLAEKYNLKFVYKDYREIFWDGQHKAKDLGLYRQKYCGCIFSIDEGGKKNGKKKNNK